MSDDLEKLNIKGRELDSARKLNEEAEQLHLKEKQQLKSVTKKRKRSFTANSSPGSHSTSSVEAIIEGENGQTSDIPQVVPQASTKVFFDIKIGCTHAVRIVMELFTDVTPITAENFRTLCTGEKGIGTRGKPLHYKGSKFENFACYGGEIIHGRIRPGGRGDGCGSGDRGIVV